MTITAETKDALRRHAREWIDAWNRRDLERVLAFYAPEVHFQAPTVAARWSKPDGVIIGTEALRRHFERGLELAPALRFELIDVLFGVDEVAVLYRRETGMMVMDTMRFDTALRATRARVYNTGSPR